MKLFYFKYRLFKIMYIILPKVNLEPTDLKLISVRPQKTCAPSSCAFPEPDTSNLSI